MIRVKIPSHLRTMAGVESEVAVEIEGPVTIRTVLDAVEAAYPMLRGTMRHHDTKERRVYLRYYACKEDFSLEPIDTRLPDEVANGEEPFWVIGAIAGG